MEEALRQVPPEAWPLIDTLFNLTLLFTGLWLAWTLFVMWRRSASNLTAVRGVGANKKATPDFLSVDEKARREALKRGDEFEKDLERRERDEERNLKRAKRRQESMVSRIGRLISLFMALFSVATMISGTIFQVTIMGRYWEQYSAGERLSYVVREHPIGVAVTAAVILYNVINFVVRYRSERV